LGLFVVLGTGFWMDSVVLEVHVLLILEEFGTVLEFDVGYVRELSFAIVIVLLISKDGVNLIIFFNSLFIIVMFGWDIDMILMII
jgi:hypothetical protein